MATLLSYPGTPPDPMQVVGLQRSAALARILHFENTMHKRLGMIRPQRYLRLFNYFSNQNLPPDNVQMPLGINYFQSICTKHTSYLWGQWQQSGGSGDIAQYRVTPRKTGSPDDVPEDQTSHAIQRYLMDLLDANEKNALLWQAALNGSIYGDTVLRLRWDPLERRVKLENLLPEWVHFRWDVTNMQQVTEVIVSYPIDRLDAQEQFGTSGNPAINYQLINPEYVPGFGIFWEHWTPTSYRRWIDDVCIEEGPNPYMRTDQDGLIYPGIIPFIHVPNLSAAGEFFGYSDAEMVTALIDEINRRVADMGDAVNNHAHPVVLLSKYNGDPEQLAVGPDAIWDMGREGTAEYLQWKGSPPAVMEYLQKLHDIMCDTANLPDITFGRMMRGTGSGSSSGSGGKGGSSGIALQMALMPAVERATQKRVQWDLALRKVAHMTTFIHAVRDPATLPFDFALYANYDVTPVFSSILPRDRMQSVNENVALVSGALRSTEAALKDLGSRDVADELRKIKGDLQFKAKLSALGQPIQLPQPVPPGMPGPTVPGQRPQMPGVPKPVGGKNSDKGRGGNPALPGGQGASNNAPGALAKAAS
jgi:Phage portal protein, SPP1 Gp6-like